MKRFYRSEKGSVSIFFLLILIAVFFFNAVLIDYARVLAAKQQTETLLKTGVRSVSAAYDTDLQKEYGLFAVSDFNQVSLLIRVLERNIASDAKGYVQMIPLRLEDESSSLYFSAPLADETIFSRQILEEMKIRAPIDFTLEVTDRLLFQRDRIKSAERSIELLERVQSIDQDRTSAIQRLMQDQEKALSELLQMADDLARALDSEGQQADFHRLIDRLSTRMTQAETLLGEASEQLERVRGQNERLKQQVAEQSGNPSDSDLTQIENAIRDSVFLDSHLDTIARSLAHHERELRTLKQTLNHLSSFTTSPERLRELKAYEKRLLDTIDDWEERLDQQRKLIGSMEEKREASKELEEQYEQEYERAEVEIFRLLDRLQALTFQSEELQAVDVLVNSYREYNQQGVRNLDHHEPGSGASEGGVSLSFLDSVLGQLSEVALGLRDELYWNEYVHSRFQSFDPRQVNLLLRESNPEQLKQLLRVKNQEIEYILYGNTRGAGNIAAAFGEIFALRYAYNMIEAVKACAGAGHPAAILMCILAKALQATLADLQALLQGRSVSFFGIRLNYHDHLRLFLFIHPANQRIYRMQALIHHHTGKDLRHRSTYMESNAEFSMPLWFLPQIFRLFAAEHEHVQGNRYYLRQRAVYSY